MWLILVDAVLVAQAVTLILALAIAFTLCADVIAEHGSEDEVLFRSEQV